jgi:hypothetical protein
MDVLSRRKSLKGTGMMGATMSHEEIAAFLASLRDGLVVVQFECCASMKLAR